MPIYVTVTPEVTVTDSTTIDASLLNRGFTPTVDITGTLDGSSGLTIAAGSVTNAMLENMAAQHVKGYAVSDVTDTTSLGAPLDIALSSNLQIASNTLKITDGSITSTQLQSTATVAAGAIADVNIATQTIGLGKLATQKVLTLVGNGGATAAVAPEPITIGSGLTVTAASELATTTKVRASNITTLGVTGHGFSAGDIVNVSGFSDTTLNVSGATVLGSPNAPTTDAFSYANVGNAITLVGDTTGKVRRTMAAGVPTSTIIATSTTNSGSAKAWAMFNIFQSATLSWTKSGTGSTAVVSVTDTGTPIQDGDIIFVAISTTMLTYTVTASTTNGFSFTDTSAAFGAGPGNLVRYGIIRGTFNVASITPLGFPSSTPGQFVVAFSSALSNARYMPILGTIALGAFPQLRLLSVSHTSTNVRTTGFDFLMYDCRDASTYIESQKNGWYNMVIFGT